jgi:integrase
MTEKRKTVEPAQGETSLPGEEPGVLQLGPDHSLERRTRREKTEWRKTLGTVQGATKRPRKRSGDPHPRHGWRYRGRLSILLRDLRKLLYQHGAVASKTSKAVGGKTRRDRRLVLSTALADMYRSGLKLTYIRNFRGKHVRAIMNCWVSRGISSATMATYVSHLRTFLGWVAKPDLLRVVDQYCLEHPGLTRRQAATDRDKSERGVNVDFNEILRRAITTGEMHFVCQLILIAVFGLRVRESWLLRPHQALDEGGNVTISHGTKGGRPRKLPTSTTEEQRSAIELACRIVPNKCGSMIPEGYVRVEDWASHFYYLCGQIGLTRNGLGITPHSLRHGVLLDLYEYFAQWSAPVRDNGVGAPIDPVHEREVRKIVAEFAGHSRTQVSSAYLGTRRKRKSREQSSERAQHGTDLPVPVDEGVSEEQSPDDNKTATRH